MDNIHIFFNGHVLYVQAKIKALYDVAPSDKKFVAAEPLVNPSLLLFILSVFTVTPVRLTVKLRNIFYVTYRRSLVILTLPSVLMVFTFICRLRLHKFVIPFMQYFEFYDCMY